MKLNIDFFKVENTNKTPNKGLILVSEPFLKDSFFSRSVVLITDHTKAGSVGFILNQYSDYKMRDLLEDFPVNSDVFIGGPVDTNSLHYIHTYGNIISNSVHVFNDIYWGGDFEQLKEGLMNSIIKEKNVRFFLGYSGWDEGQLEKELQNDYWLITKTNTKNILHKNPRIWEECLINLGGKYKSWVNTPADPALN